MAGQLGGTEKGCMRVGRSEEVISEQRLCDQLRAIRKNGWLSQVEIEKIRRKVTEDVGEESRNSVDRSVSVEESGNVSLEEEGLFIDVVDGPRR
uniref:Uncharacterized protein n=1 Tax=Amphimedon queenslandica TaxID=400682 RepID=A0A1X7THQ8_AMPQE